MTFKTSFTKEEWAILVKGPFYAGSAIGSADIHHRDQKKEQQVMVKEATLWQIPDEAKDLIRPIFADIGKFREDTENLPGYVEVDDSATWQLIALQGLRDIMTILKAKTSAEEVTAYTDWMMYVAEKTAEASRESALGITGPRVSDKEKDALEQVKQALEITS